MNEKPSAIKDIKFAKWADHYAYLESMKGGPWKSALRHQAHLFNQVAHIPSIKKYTAQFEIISSAARAQTKTTALQSEKLPDYIPKWLRIQEPEFYIYKNEAGELKGVLATYGIKQGSNFYTLGYFPKNSSKPRWVIQHTGSNIFVKDNYCYFTSADPITNRDCKLMCCKVETGRERSVLFTEENPHKSVILYPCENRQLFIQIENSGIFDLYYVDCNSKKVQLCDNKSVHQIACGYLNKPVWISYGLRSELLRNSGSNRKPTLHNCNYNLSSDDMIIYWGAVNRGWLLGYAYGNACLYRWTASECKPIYSVKAGYIFVDSNIEYYNHDKPLPMIVKGAMIGVEKLQLAEGVMTIKPQQNQQFTEKYIASERQAHSFDGTHVPYHLVKATTTKKPCGLLVYGYGSYGATTNIHNCIKDFAPLLDIGWVIAYAYIRGGGDGDYKWAADGRLYNRIRSIEDFEAVILSARGSTGVSADRTVISGRSAGGMLVGAVAARNSGGQLFKGVWAEEPFVDAVTSMANDNYPHTMPEQGEFGDPKRSALDFMTTMEFSPYHRVAGCGAPGLFVLARAAENDSQVLAYEPLKWILELQNADAATASATATEGKLYAFGVNQGHHYVEEDDIKARCTDMAIFHCWATEPAVRQKISAISIKMAGNTRNRNRSTATRKQRKMNGGKRKATTRKNRKASRKQRK